LSSRGHDIEDGSSERASSFVSGIDEEAKFPVSDEVGVNQGETAFSDDDMELIRRTRREVDEILEQQDKRARGEEAGDKECNTPSYPKARKSSCDYYSTCIAQ
jgi:hypothetical protein